MVAVVNGKIGLEDSMVGGEGVAEVDVVVGLAVGPVDEGQNMSL